MNTGTRGRGRPKGSKNKLPLTFKQAVIDAFEELGGTGTLVKWGKSNPTEFYKIAARLIPTEVQGPGENGEHKVTISWQE